ncbi:MAG: porin [Rhodobacteraceae bacterium]|nr:porin [Paracoccaceae bacterium]
MRKLSLLAAAAMVAGGSAFAMDGGGVSISGEANFGVKFAESDDDSKSELQFHHEFKVTFAASETTDGGIGFGGEMTLDNTESVSGRTAVAAPTAYMITASDVDDAGKLKAARQKALESLYGIDLKDFTENDVIVSGAKTLSGYEKATIAGHTAVSTRVLNSDDNTEFEGSLIFRNRDGELKGYDLDSLTVAAGSRNDEITPTAPRAVMADDTVSIGGADYIVATTLVAGGAGYVDGIESGDRVNGEWVWVDPAVNEAAGTLDPGDGAAQGNTIILGDTTYVIQVGETAPTLTSGQILVTEIDDRDNVFETGDGTIIRAHTVAEASAVRHVSLAALRGDFNTSVTGDNKKAASEAYIAALSGSITEADSQSVNNHGEVYISMDMHKLTIGSDLDAADKMAGGLADPGFDGIGIDDVAEGVWGKSAADVRYDGDFGVAAVAISYGDNKGDAEWAAGFKFSVDPVTFGAGFDSKGVMSVGMGFSQGLISMNALYSTDSDHDEADNEAISEADLDKTEGGVAGAKTRREMLGIRVDEVANKPDLKNQGMGVDVTYKMSEETSLTLVAAQSKTEKARWSRGETKADDGWVTTSKTVDAFGVGFEHDLGGGAKLKAGAGSVDSEARADLGITMTF